MTVEKPLAVTVEERAGGALWRVALAAPKANVLDARMVTALTEVFERAVDASGLKGVVLTAEGPSFSFGASVQEHLPEHVAGMLETFHGLFRAIAGAAVPVLAAVRGHCLGGGLELAAFCHRLVVAPDATLGQPEIVLGVFAPVASALLAERAGQGVSCDLCLSGRTLTGREAVAARVADEVADDPEAAAWSWAETHLLSHSASSLRFAVRAARLGFERRFFATLENLERLYLDELMATGDAREGIQAFLDKRSPQWRNV